MELVATAVRAARNPRFAIRAAIALSRGGYYRIKYRILGRRVVIGRWFAVSGGFDIRGPGTVIIGNHCAVNSPRLSPTTLCTHAPDSVIELSDEVLLGGPQLECWGRIVIGERVTMADARLMDTDFPHVRFQVGARAETNGSAPPIVVGRNAWIGIGALVLKGVKIGENSVVGAGAVVTCEVPPNAVVFGNPARIVPISLPE